MNKGGWLVQRVSRQDTSLRVSYSWISSLIRNTSQKPSVVWASIKSLSWNTPLLWVDQIPSICTRAIWVLNLYATHSKKKQSTCLKDWSTVLAYLSAVILYLESQSLWAVTNWSGGSLTKAWTCCCNVVSVWFTSCPSALTRECRGPRWCPGRLTLNYWTLSTVGKSFSGSRYIRVIFHSEIKEVIVNQRF